MARPISTVAPVDSPRTASFPSAPAGFGSAPPVLRAPSGSQVRDFSGRFGSVLINWVGLGELLRMPTDAETWVLDATEEAANRLADDMVAYAQLNAPWEDRTGEARRELNARVVQERNYTWTVILAHGVDYGVYLENANGGQYAIIIPTIEHFAGEIGGRVLNRGSDVRA